MSQKHTHLFSVKSSTPPVIEIDPGSGAIYVRFRKDKVSRTIPSFDTSSIVNLDLNEAGDVVGIEAIGVEGLTLRGILQMARVDAPKIDLASAVFSRPGAAVLQEA